MPLGAWASRPRPVEKTYIFSLRCFDYSLRRPQARRLRSQRLRIENPCTRAFSFTDRVVTSET